MLELLLLGIIPGTNIQINFADWLKLSESLIACLLLILLYKNRRIFTFAGISICHYAGSRLWLLVLRIQLSRHVRKSAPIL